MSTYARGDEVRFVTAHPQGRLATFDDAACNRPSETTIPDGTPGRYVGPHEAPDLAAQGWHVCTTDAAHGGKYVPVHEEHIRPRRGGRP